MFQIVWLLIELYANGLNFATMKKQTGEIKDIGN